MKLKVLTLIEMTQKVGLAHRHSRAHAAQGWSQDYSQATYDLKYVTFVGASLVYRQRAQAVESNGFHSL